MSNKQQDKYNQKQRNKYQYDLEYREQKKKQARDYYYKKIIGNGEIIISNNTKTLSFN